MADLATATTVPEGTFGGKVYGRPNSNTAVDRAYLESLGARVLRETVLAGSSEFLIACDMTVLRTLTNTDERMDLPSYLYLLPVGEPLTDETILIHWPEGRIYT